MRLRKVFIGLLVVLQRILFVFIVVLLSVALPAWFDFI